MELVVGVTFAASDVFDARWCLRSLVYVAREVGECAFTLPVWK